ncbi:MAG: hypothetical protein COW66_02665 [Flavobacteriaceae bacterium CG18_big_fil_WC_8_21_14_2_50_34_36]|nr:MAG: hypothetical protein COW66_02665 [Flavobacteriaceae bacterium CG18_big_fil_WC_8_21_14_2_50_34_36]PJC06643.1 MAG: hypothetical protein CO068_10150 [Flavobacteriaceae bacterium CG_4_9_14_0_8_um_filter_34_30]
MSYPKLDNLQQCIWCLKNEPNITFLKKAHTIPRSLGGKHYNKKVCDNCNEFFGDRKSLNNKYSIETVLKEAFIVSRTRYLPQHPKKNVGKFKSQFFEIKYRNNKPRLSPRISYKFSSQTELCRAFKRGLYKMYFEEISRQNGIGFEDKFNLIRNFARFDIGDLPVYYFTKRIGATLMFKSESETPILLFNRMKYLYSDEKFVEIEFLGHVLGFPIAEYSKRDLEKYLKKSIDLKKEIFSTYKEIQYFTDIDFTLSLFDSKPKNQNGDL